MAVESLVRMANQIAANVRHRDDEQAVADLANHLRMFWAPSMRAELAAHVAESGTGDLDPLAVRALEQVMAQNGH